MSKIFLILFLLSLNQTFCQNENDENLNNVYVRVLGKYFNHLKPLDEAKEIISLKSISFSNLFECVAGVEYTENEKNIQDAILKRATEITILLYNEGTPVYLTSGMNSSNNADMKNQNLNDDNNLVYISIAECLSSNTLEKIKNVVNKQTLKLISKN